MLTDTQRQALLSRLRQQRLPADPAARVEAPIPRREPGLDRPPLSYGQEQLWFVDRFAPGLPTYNIPLALRLAGPLDVAALQAALGGLTARHEALRTRLAAGDDGRPAQVIDPPGTVPLPVRTVHRDQLGQLIRAEAMRPFDLATGPLLRTTLARLDATEHILIAVLHHTIFDGVSAGVFLRDLAALYHAEVTGTPAALPELPVQFADYAVWERRRLQGPAAHLARTVPAVMIPERLAVLQELPLTEAGRVDYAALPQLAAESPGGGYGPEPATLIEVMLADIYATVLGVPHVAATDSFFDLGGNSLHAMRLISVLDAELDVDVGAAAVFLAPTPRQLAEVLRTEHGFADEPRDGMVRLTC